MKKIFYIIPAAMLFLFIYSCSKTNSGAEYMPLVEELHKIECEQIKKSGINFVINDTNIYTFREIAFETIMTKDVNAAKIAKYEELYQKLAAMEYFMEDSEKIQYYSDVRNVYLKQCQ